MDTSEYTVNKEKIDSAFTERRDFKQWLIDNQIGIYVTVILHLFVFLVLAINKIQTLSSRKYMGVIELVARVPEKTPEELKKEEDARIKKEIDQALKAMPSRDNQVPNLVSNAAVEGTISGRGGSNVSFFSSVNTATLKEVKEKEKAKTTERKENQGIDNVPTEAAQTSSSGAAYKGPSVVSYYLNGRIAISIPVPAYKCLNGGDVRVIIEVNKLGFVVNSSVDNAHSSKDECLIEAALQAALQAHFSPSETPENQTGNIVYRFISQN